MVVPTNPTAIYTRGWWPTSLADPARSIFVAGWLRQANVEIVTTRVFPLHGPFQQIGLLAALAIDLRLKTVIGLALQLPAQREVVRPLKTMLRYTFRLHASEDLHERL